MERSLIASINGTQVGTLHDIGGVWAFKYANAWLSDPESYALSPSIPLTSDELIDQSSIRPIQWYFDNLLPEEGQRILLARDAHVSNADAFGLLMAYGAESAGSLTLMPEFSREQAGGARPLSDVDLEKRLKDLPRVALSHGAAKRMSHAGAQHKLAVISRDGALFEPEGSMPSTHILKPNHDDATYPHFVINEFFVMKLAERLGLSVPRVHRRYVPSPVYIIDRFDRVARNGTMERLHAIDACQLLGIDRTFKYQQGSVETLALLTSRCRNKILSKRKIFEWLVFNVLVGNTDSHLKNLSFITTHEGISLAPHYDMLSTACYETRAFGGETWPDRTRLAWPISGCEFLADVGGEQLISSGIQLGLSRETATRVLNAISSKIGPAAESLVKEIEDENSSLIKSNPGIAHTLSGEMRCLRVIQHSVIKETALRIISGAKPLNIEKSDATRNDESSFKP